MVILTKFHIDWPKIMDVIPFSIFWECLILYDSDFSVILVELKENLLVQFWYKQVWKDCPDQNLSKEIQNSIQNLKINTF